MIASKGWSVIRFTGTHRCTLALLFVTLLLISLACPFSVLAGKGPQVVLPQSEFDFGTALEGNTVVHDFVIQNKGDEPLIIHRVRTG